MAAATSPLQNGRVLNVPVDHSLQRKQALALARPCDHAGRFVASFDPAFDLTKTIFKTLPVGPKTLLQRTKLDTRFSWHEDATAAIQAAYLASGPAPSISDDAPLHKFMMTECDFSCEHADGSFMDHLHFCREYTARHYPQTSPRTMLLHSIMGVGTNCFPMGLEKLPTLKSLLTEEEMAHVQAFPTVLRLLIHGPLLKELQRLTPEKLKTLKSIKMHRLLDNAQIEMEAEDLWVHLNLQMIHAIDFLPAASWQVRYELIHAQNTPLSCGLTPAFSLLLCTGSVPATSTSLPSSSPYMSYLHAAMRGGQT